MILILKISRSYKKEAGPEGKANRNDRRGADSPHACFTWHPLERGQAATAWDHGAGSLSLILCWFFFSNWTLIVNATESLENQNHSPKPPKALKCVSN